MPWCGPRYKAMPRRKNDYSLEEMGKRTNDKGSAGILAVAAENTRNMVLAKQTSSKTGKAVDGCENMSETVKAVADSSRLGHLAAEFSWSTGKSVASRGKVKKEKSGNAQKEEISRSSHEGVERIRKEREQSGHSSKGPWMTMGFRPKDPQIISNGPITCN